MSSPIRPIPNPQARAFDLAVATRLGLDVEQVTDDFCVNFTTNIDDSGMARVTFTGTVYMPTEEVLAMFNAAAGRPADG